MNARLNRLLGADGRCFDVAVDHGFFGELAFLTGIEDMRRVVATLVAAAPDAVQLSPGQAPILQRLPGPKPALVLRADIANVYGTAIPKHLFSEVVAAAVARAIRLDAACLCVNLLSLPDRPELLHQCIRNIAELQADCEQVGMPLMVEPLVMKPGRGGYGVDGDPD